MLNRYGIITCSKNAVKLRIKKLKKLSEDYKGYSNPDKFIGNVKDALGLNRGEGPSSYGEHHLTFSLSKKSFSIRISNHNAVAETYNGRESDFNLSIVISKRGRKPNFRANNKVVLDDIAYTGKRLENLQSPLSDIIDGIIDYLKTGVYTDRTGVGILRKSPEGRETSNQEIVYSFKSGT